MKIRLWKYKDGSIRWCVDYGKIGGKRRREFFGTETEAIKALKAASRQARLHGTHSVAMSLGARVRYTEAEKRLEAVGATIEQAVDHFIRHHGRLSEPMLACELVERCIEGKRAQGRRPQYLRMLRVAASRLPKELLAHEVTPNHVRSLLEASISPKTRNNWLSDIRSIWKWGIAHGIATSDPTEGIPRFADDRGEIEFLSVEQVRKLMDTCPPDLLAFHALGIFAGIRPEEIRRMTWDDIRLDEGTATVRAISSKTRQRRVVELEPAAISYLKPAIGPIVKARCEKQLADFRRSLGFPWPHDAMRHTYATYYFAHFRDERKLQANMGHRSGNILFQHYRALASAKDAAAFWALRGPLLHVPVP